MKMKMGVCERWKLILTSVKLPRSLAILLDHLLIFLLHWDWDPSTQNPILILASLLPPTTSHVGIPITKPFHPQTSTSIMQEPSVRNNNKMMMMMMMNLGTRGSGGLMSLQKLRKDIVPVLGKML